MYETEKEKIANSLGFPLGRNKMKVIMRREIKQLENQGKVFGFSEMLNFEQAYIWNAFLKVNREPIDMSRFYDFEKKEVQK